ncbi:hypothetical protein H0H81_011053 [Sphagnurus paluster]|uniref:Cytochrome P450 n=1 Tax=Sphagnurus paluster TaxID=117069 RepID=A0A9P7FYH6_9AGAR|nr:hypothetical protein H0H81_011053 [Sphagnurus paluster]
MYITYGHRVTSNDDPFMVLADEVGGALALAGSLGAGLVDFFPILAYLPSWFPGTYFMNHARKWEPKLEEMLENPFQDLMKKLNQGSAKPCIVTSQLESLERNGGNSIISIGDIKGAARQAYFAGAETTSSVLTVFILAVILHPECQVKAQAELDAVVGPERLPEFGDRHSLPYLECLLHETLRQVERFIDRIDGKLNAVRTKAIPHLAVNDDIYRGMFIPKGSLVIGNVRGMSWDEKVYANPFSFEPTRYLPAPLGRGEPHPTAHWGFGRRICPGRHLADSSVWIAMATLLSTLSISKALGEDGKEITPEITFVTSLTR